VPRAFYRCIAVVFLWAGIVVPVVAAEADSWPPLPEQDGTAAIPAQSWKFKPGPRTVKAYVFYPGGRLENVTEKTGLFLSLHNWGGTGWSGTADPKELANRLDVVAICVNYLQSGKWRTSGGPYDFGYLQALDALRALYWVFDGLEKLGKPFAEGRIFATGGSGGGNVTLMINKLAPRTFTCAVDMCGMAKLSDDMAFGIPGRTHLNAGYSRDPNRPNYLSRDEQEIRFVGHPKHVAAMKRLGNSCKLLVVHGTTDASCPVADAMEMVANMKRARLDVEPHFITKKDLDGTALKSTGHSLGNRTLIVLRLAGNYLRPDGPQALVRKTATDFQRRDAKVRYRTSGGSFVISYEAGYPVGRFEPK